MVMRHARTQTEPMGLDQFHHLAAQSRRLEHALDNDARPHIERGLDQLERASRSLASRSARAALLQTHDSAPSTSAQYDASASTFAFNQHDDVRAYNLLASTGFDIEEAATTLNTLRVQATLDAQRSIPPANVTAFTDYQYEEGVLSLLESVSSNTLDDADTLVDHAANVEWELAKKQVLQEVGQFLPMHLQSTQASHDKPDPFMRSAYGQSSMTSSMPNFRTSLLYPSLSGGVSGLSASVSTAAVAAYRSVVIAMNEHRAQSIPFDIIDMFQKQLSDLSQNPESTVNGHSGSTLTPTPYRVQEAWALLGYILGRRSSRDGGKALRELEFISAYRDPAIFKAQGAGSDLRERLIIGARSFLEEQFYDFVESTVAKNPKSALVGGAPSVQAQVAGFVRSRFYRYGRWDLQDLELVNGHPLWAQIFYLIRGGKRMEALEYAQQNAFYFTTLGHEESNFCASLEAWVNDGELSQVAREHIRQFYANHLSVQPSDPFKLAIYSILGPCRAINMPEVIQATEDWLWLKLATVRRDDANDSDYHAHSFRTLQKEILRLEHHFSKNRTSPLKYFQCLLMVGLFEAAVLHLYQFPELQVDAVHFAIALQYYGLLRVPTETQTMEPRIENDDGTVYVNIVAIMQRYFSSQLSAIDPSTALHYILAMAIYACRPEMVSIKERACDALVDLIIKSPNQEALVGLYLANGQRKPGLIERFLPLLVISPSEYISSVVRVAAQRADELDDLYYAVTLYMLSEDFDAAVLILSRHLCETFAQGSYIRSQRERNTGPRNAEELMKFAQRVTTLFSQPSNSNRISDSMRDTLTLVYSLLEWKTFLESGKTADALNYITSLRLLPLHDHADQQEIVSLSQKLRSYDTMVQQCMPTVFVKTMQLLVNLARELSLSPHLDTARCEKIELYRRKARNLVSFAAQLPFKMDGNIYATLNRMEVEMPVV